LPFHCPVFAALRPYLLKQTVDDYIQTKDAGGLLFYITLMESFFYVKSFRSFTLLGKLAGQDIVKTFGLSCSSIF
jgi:hypothetical protein